MQGNEGPQGQNERKMLLNMDQGQRGIHCQGATRNVPQEELLLNMDHGQRGIHCQGANLNVAQEEMLLNNLKDLTAHLQVPVTTQTLGFRVLNIISADSACTSYVG